MFINTNINLDFATNVSFISSDNGSVTLPVIWIFFLSVIVLVYIYIQVDKYKEGWESQQSIHRIACQAMETQLEALKAENKRLKDQINPVSFCTSYVYCAYFERIVL